MTLQALLGIERPIVQAPMAGVHGSRLTVAVSNAGGLGSLPCAMLDAEALERELATIRAQTDRPYNVNFFCHRPPSPDAPRDAAWRKVLLAYGRELGVEPGPMPARPGRAPFDAETLAVLARFEPPVVSFHFGLPAPELLLPIKRWGGKVLSSATTVTEARWLESQGADIIVAQGLEAGGHRGMFLSSDVTAQLGTVALLPQVVRAVRVPVLAAGGIADAGGVAAARALGAAGVQVGTAYLCCPETDTSAVHRAALQSAAAAHTALTNLFTGRPARAIVNRLMRELGPLRDGMPDFPLAAAALAPLRAAAEAAGSGDFSPLWAGQNASGCRAIPAAALTHALGAAKE